MFKSIMLAGTVTLSAMAVAPAAEAKTNVTIHFGVPFHGYQVEPDWEYYDGYGWYDADRYGDFDRYRHRTSNFQVFFGVPFYAYRVGPDWRYYDGYGWYDYRRHGNIRERIGNKLSCSQARRLVDRSGYNKVQVRECEGRTYTFTALRKGKRVTVFVNSRTGDIWRG
jgi:hypothetical protein